MAKNKKEKRKMRHKRVRAVIKGTANRPRLCVFRSNKYIYTQLIDDTKGITIVSAGDLKKAAFRVGEILAGKAKEKKIKNVVFDRGGYKYHGRIKALAQGARAGGLKF